MGNDKTTKQNYRGVDFEIAEFCTLDIVVIRSMIGTYSFILEDNIKYPNDEYCSGQKHSFSLALAHVGIIVEIDE